MQTEQRFYQLVAANSEVSQDYIIPNGNIFSVQRIIINTPTPFAETGVVIWDPSGANVILMSCSGNAEGSYPTDLVGDGVKVVRIKLINTASIDQYMGASFAGGLT